LLRGPVTIALRVGNQRKGRSAAQQRAVFLGQRRGIGSRRTGGRLERERGSEERRKHAPPYGLQPERRATEIDIAARRNPS
jgi:hypothetical protein